MTIEGVREYKFDPKNVIEGLNGYYERGISNSFIRVYRDFFEGPAYLGPDVWLSALIEWLREDYDIFYYPGMDIRDSGGPGLILDQVEAARNAAKICGLRAHIKDEMSKRGLWCTAEDIPELVDTLFKAYDERGKRADKNRVDATKLSEVNHELNIALNISHDAYRKLSNRKDHMMTRLNHIVNNGVEFQFDEDKVIDRLEERLKVREERITELTTALDISKDAYRKLLDERNAPDVDIREKARNEVFYYIIGTYQKHGLDPSDIYSPNNSLEDVIYRLIVRYEAKVKLYNQLKREGVDRNDVIKKLKELLNEINKEEDE